MKKLEEGRSLAQGHINIDYQNGIYIRQFYVHTLSYCLEEQVRGDCSGQGSGKNR